MTAPEWEPWVPGAKDWVQAVERAYVAAAFPEGASAQLDPRTTAGASGPRVVRKTEPPTDPLRNAVAAAAAGAVASRFLAVGTPRSIGFVGSVAACALSLAAHRVWFQPSDLRCAGMPEAEGTDLAAALGGRAVSLAEALAADIVCVHAPIALEAAQLRRGTHVNALAAVSLAEELRAKAELTDEPTGLPALAAGLRDGRQLDELTIFVGGDLEIARRAIAARG